MNKTEIQDTEDKSILPRSAFSLGKKQVSPGERFKKPKGCI